ncbi:MAG: metalloregulator ArsR/SmtB family transcription factor [Proteobacteria bacterium]|nr:metalloregulator ArsR/SmtB family transcription factor [Pseudomonadota bacterium]
MHTQQALDALAGLAQKSRLAIFRHLVELGPEGACPGDLGEALGITATTLSFHLKTLLQAGLIDAEQNGRSITYRANFAAMQGLVGYLTENCCGGDSARCAPTPAVAARRG